MRILIINTSERLGGPAVASSRLMEALKNNGIKAKMLVRDKQTEQLSVVKLRQSWRLHWHFLWERVVILAANRFKRNNLFTVDIANSGTDITHLPEFVQADIIHLHWINQGMLSLKNLKKIIESGKPIVWTMHDMWTFTGICHYPKECDKFTMHCRNCQYLYKEGGKKDLSSRIFKKKEALYANAKIIFVACSKWLEGEAQKSKLLHGQVITNIPNPINLNLFHPRDKQKARTHLLFPVDKKLLLFGAQKITDKRKGLEYLVEACRILVEKHPEIKDDLGVVVFGNQSMQLQNLLPLQVYPLNYVNSEKEMVEIYNAVDLYVTPSLEDNLPNTVMEAMACGVPCVGFDVGGIPQMIDHLHNGYVAEYKSAEDFANGIYWTLTESEYPGLSEGAYRKVAANYSESVIAKRYTEIYNKMIRFNASY